MRIADVLRNKGADVATIAPETTVSELIAGLADPLGDGLLSDPDGPTLDDADAPVVLPEAATA